LFTFDIVFHVPNYFKVYGRVQLATHILDLPLDLFSSVLGELDLFIFLPHFITHICSTCVVVVSSLVGLRSVGFSPIFELLHALFELGYQHLELRFEGIVDFFHRLRSGRPSYINWLRDLLDLILIRDLPLLTLLLFLYLVRSHIRLLLRAVSIILLTSPTFLILILIYSRVDDCNMRGFLLFFSLYAHSGGKLLCQFLFGL
jgi:hypothetical protein